MIRAFSLRAALVVIGGGVIAACSGETSSGLFSQPDGGDASSGSGGGTSTGGAAVGGAGGAAGASAGGKSGASGGAPGGGSAGTGGVGGAGGAQGKCAPPVDSTQTALCVTLVPEAITAESDPALDESGALVIQVFDTPHPPQMNASQVALAERVLPANPTQGEFALASLQTERLVGTFPATVYVRALFVDNPAILAQAAGVGYGVWIGGVDLSDGVQDGEPLLPVNVGIGEGNPLSMPLVALRKLTVTVHDSVTPIGDGQGPLTALVVNDSNVLKKPPTFGLAHSPCADVTKGDVTLTGFVTGAGPYFVTAVLDDLGEKGDLPPGSLAAITVGAGKITIPGRLTIAPGDYTPTASVDLSYAVPRPSDAGPVPPNSCADLGGPDGGALDAGP